jgi:hypothetical protein
MRIWTPIVLLIILAGISGCSSSEGPQDASATPADAASQPAATAATGSSSTPAADVPKVSTPAVPAPKPIVIPAGTELSVILADSLHSGKNKAGDEFVANLAAPLMIDSRTAIDKGAKVQGRVVDLEGSGRVSGKATMTLTLTGVTHKGKVIPIVTKTHFEEAKGTKGRDAAVIAGAAGVGAAIGAIAGGKKGAATGGAIGGAAGTGTVLATKGEEVEYPAETRLAFTLDKELQIIP